MKKHLSTIIPVLVFIVGLSLLLYPTVSNFWNSMHQSLAVANYSDAVDKMNQQEKQAAIDAAVAYNEAGCIGILEIPALHLRLPVLSTWSYALLKKAPCRYTGSVYLDNMVIAAHNSKAHFKKLSQLEKGDIITFTDAVGNVFSYEVAGIEILQPDQVEDMTSGHWPLTMFTCTYGGASRVTVRCEKENE